MSQAIFKDPIVSSAPVLTGVGNGTVTVDRLTHFTITQTYTLTCIAKSPDTLFSVTGSLDGPVGIAAVGTQFFDKDLKVFFTIQQGSTPFEIGDIFEFAVQNGTDLHQDNIDDYDELPQKNFGEGVKGTNSGDHNLRYLSAAQKAYRYLQDLKYEAAVAGPAGDDVSIEYFDPVAAVAATLTKQDLTFTATPGAAGNDISIEYAEYTPAAKASKVIQNISYVADNFGDAGNDISIEYIGGGTAGAEIVDVVGNAITVTIEDGVSTAAQIATAIAASVEASALVDTSFSGLSSTPQTIQGPTFLEGGLDAFGEAGDEEVSVVGTAVTVTLESGVSTAQQVKDALEASAAFTALGVAVTISGSASNPQTAPSAAENLTGGADSYGFVGDETVLVDGNAIKIYFESGKSTATQIKTAYDAVPAAVALAVCTIVGFASNPQYGPTGPHNLIGGKNKFYSFNHSELTDPGSFVEGNAGLRARDAILRGKLEVQDRADMKGVVRLDDSDTANNYSGPAILNVQRVINEILSDEKITLRVDNSETKVTWAKPNLTFEDDIIIRFNDTGFENTIDASESPITLADGESAYVILNRHEDWTVEVIVAALVPQHPDAFRLATRHGDHVRLWDNTLVRDGKSARIGEGGDGGSGGIAKVSFIDPISTVLPTGASVTIDGVAGVNKDLVLFTNLASGANRVYELNGVGSSITWTPVKIFPNGLDAEIGDMVIAQKGVGFANQLAKFDGTKFHVNDFVRYFNGADYWEMSSLKTLNMVNNTTADVFSVAYAGSEHMIVDYSIVRGTAHETGTLHITTDGVDVSVTTTGAYEGSSGVTFSGIIDGANIRIQYTTDNSGPAGTMKYFVRRWSNAAGGPGGIPSYSSGSSGSISAAGASGQIQFNGSGLLDADADFAFDSANNILKIAGLEIVGLSNAIVLNDNQASPATIITYNKTSYPYAIIEFSVLRDGVAQVGRMFVVTNGTDVSITVDDNATDIMGSGISFEAAINGSNVEIKYTSTNTGAAGSFKYSMRRWA